MLCRITSYNVCYTKLLRKMRLVADMVRGMEVNRALDVLKFSSKEAVITSYSIHYTKLYDYQVDLHDQHYLSIV